MPSTSGTNPPPPPIERPLSPVERILGGSVDGRALAPVDSKMDGLLIALAKVMKLLTKEKLSSQEKQRAYNVLNQISTEDIRRAVRENADHTINQITSFEDVTLQKIEAPEIQDNAVDYVSPTASKDFNTRINGGYFCSNAKHTVKMRDILQSVADVVTYYRLSPKAALNLLRRCLRDPARQLLDNLVNSGSSLADLFVSLQDHFNSTISSSEASQKLRTLLNNPIQNLDDFLGELLNLSIASVKDLPHSEQSKAGFLMATSYVQQYIHKYHNSLSTVIKHDFKQIQSAQKGRDPAAAYLAMMRVLRLHRDALESQGKRNPRPGHINAISADDDPNLVAPAIQELKTPMVANSPSAQEIRNIIRDEIQQTPLPPPKHNAMEESKDIKNMIQELMLEMAVQNTQPTPIFAQPMAPSWEQAGSENQAAMIQEMNNPNWQRNRPNGQGYNPNNQGNRNGFGNGNNQGGIMPKWVPQMVQKAGQMIGGGMPLNNNQAQNGFGQNPNRQPLGYNPQMGNQNANFGFRRRMVPEEVYNKYFANGSCFLCSMQGHSYRQCPIFGEGHPVTPTPCPDCESHQIKAYHANCHGKNFKAHQNMARGQNEVGQWPKNQNQNQQPNTINQIDCPTQFYPEEGLAGLHVLPGEPCSIQENNTIPLYVPGNAEWSKNA